MILKMVVVVEMMAAAGLVPVLFLLVIKTKKTIMDLIQQERQK
jgi:hypothetical protein